jgi:hypothetical protein
MLIKILTNLSEMRIVNIILRERLLCKYLTAYAALSTRKWVLTRGAPEITENPTCLNMGGETMYQNTRIKEEHDSIDALVALQLLEEQEQAAEQEFFRLTGEIQQFGFRGPELETELPNLLNTRRERALYEALITLIRTPQQAHLAQMQQYGNRGSVEREFRGLF